MNRCFCFGVYLKYIVRSCSHSISRVVVWTPVKIFLYDYQITFSAEKVFQDAGHFAFVFSFLSR